VAAADVVVLVLGLSQFITNGEGVDRAYGADGYALPGKQLELVQLVARLNKPTVVVLLSGMAVGIDFIARQTRWPLLIPGYGGPYGAVAIAQALFGRTSPSGKLSYTIYPEEWAAATPMADMSLTAGAGRTYRWYGYSNATAAPPAFAFGAGLSYSSFTVAVSASHGAVPAVPAAVPRSSSVLGTFTVTTTNTGSRFAASDATLVFVLPNQTNISAAAPTPLPRRQLVNFIRTPELAPGGSYSETVYVRLKDVAMANFAGATVAYKGCYGILFSNGAGAETTHTVTVAVDSPLDQLPLPPGFAT